MRMPHVLKYECQLRLFCALITVFACTDYVGVSQALETQEKAGITSDGQHLLSFWGTVAREVAPKVGVFVFAIVSLATFLFIACRQWLFRQINKNSAQFGPIPASFWLPRSVLFGAATGIIVGILTALFAPVLTFVYSKSSQILPENINSLIFGLVGVLLLAALLQYAYEVFFGWTPFRGNFQEQPYKYKIKKLSHRLGVTLGLVTACLVLVMAAGAARDVYALHTINVAIYILCFVIVASTAVYWLTRFFGWLLEGDLLIIVLIILFSILYWLSKIVRVLRMWVGGQAIGAYPARTRSMPTVALESASIDKPYELRRYHDQRLLWVPVFLILMGMILLLVLPVVGVILLVAGGISVVLYLTARLVESGSAYA